jgi:AmiR/NasT family two-component response regulator
MSSDVDKAREAGCAGHISKPISTREFLSTIHLHINKSNPERGNS